MRYKSFVENNKINKIRFKCFRQNLLGNVLQTLRNLWLNCVGLKIHSRFKFINFPEMFYFNNFMTEFDYYATQSNESKSVLYYVIQNFTLKLKFF